MGKTFVLRYRFKPGRPRRLPSRDEPMKSNLDSGHATEQTRRPSAISPLPFMHALAQFLRSVIRPWLLAPAFACLAFSAPAKADLWARENLVAWCIVPYDAKKRDPEQRAEMLQKLGFRHYAYDWRAEHVPQFDAEVKATRRRGIEITAWWFPTKLDDNARRILDVIQQNKIHPQLWVTGAGELTKSAEEQKARIDRELDRLRPIVQAAARLGCTVGLYNHGGWFGEAENQIAILQRLRSEKLENVRLIYNFHHGHDHIADFARRWSRMAPYVDTVNINGMFVGGDKSGKKIHSVGEGDQELALLRIIQQSGWRGKIGILNHRTDVDAEEGLKKNLAGLERLAAELR
jgi:hypothetical protein